MSLFLLAGTALMIMVLMNKKRIAEWIGEPIFLAFLTKKEWYQNKWLSGLCLFLTNAILFGLAAAVLYFTSFLLIPYIHLAIMLAAVIASIVLWSALANGYHQGAKSRLISGLLGSSFYLLLLVVFGYMIANLPPDTPENDQFMAFIGLVFASFVCIVAFLSCLWITGFRKEASN